MNIKDYKDYEVMDFVEEDQFRNWVISGDKSLDFFWQAYLKKYPVQESKMEEARQLIMNTHNYFHKKAEEITPPIDDFKSKLKANFEEEKMPPLPKTKSNLFLLYKLTAAACILLIGIFSIYYFQVDTKSQVEYTTSNGEWKEITLPDGTLVELNANTQLSLTKEWKKGEDRVVWLKGEAFFKVKKQPSTNAKFKVITKDLKVEVLGTIFNVNTRNQHTEVFLEEGKIVLELNNKKEQIEPGEFVSYSQEKKQVIKRYKKTEEIHSNWKDGVLKINDATLKEILDEIESIYGIDLIVNNQKILEKEGSVAIPVDNLTMTTAILERILNVKIEKKGKQLFIN